MLLSVVTVPGFTKGQALVTQESHFTHMDVSILQHFIVKSPGKLA